jgi:hypothetical protein
MRSSAPQIIRFSNNRGTRGSVVLTSAVGTGLEAVTEVRFSGSGVQALIIRPPRPDAIDVAISISADAAPGPRAALLAVGRGERSGGKSESEASAAQFYVLAPSSYAGRSGIGSHLL